MTFDLTNTTTGRIRDGLLAARQRVGGPALGMVLTLVIVTTESDQYDAVRSANQAAQEHPSRVIAVIRRDTGPDSRLDAEVRVGETGPGETVILRLYGPVSEHADSVVGPLLVPDAPVVTWWPGGGPEVPSRDPLGALAQRRVTDAAASPRPLQMLRARAASYQPGDTDFAWTRLTGWRTLLAAQLDDPRGEITGGSVSAQADNPSAELLASWLESKLGITVERAASGGPGITEVRLHAPAGDLVISRPDARSAHLVEPGRPQREAPLHRRATPELLAEELRRLDPDEVYAETIDRAAQTVPPVRRDRPRRVRKDA